MQVISECVQSIQTLMDEIAVASVQQSEMIVSVENRIKEISRVRDFSIGNCDSVNMQKEWLSNVLAVFFHRMFIFVAFCFTGKYQTTAVTAGTAARALSR